MIEKLIRYVVTFTRDSFKLFDFFAFEISHPSWKIRDDIYLYFSLTNEINASYSPYTRGP